MKQKLNEKERFNAEAVKEGEKECSSRKESPCRNYLAGTASLTPALKAPKLTAKSTVANTVSLTVLL